ncbi:MAG: hypothetical protein ACM3U2_20360, partial [Deltaproteobacteria bacterium]
EESGQFFGFFADLKGAPGPRGRGSATDDAIPGCGERPVPRRATSAGRFYSPIDIHPRPAEENRGMVFADWGRAGTSVREHTPPGFPPCFFTQGVVR